MTINLTELVSQAEQDYQDVDCSFGTVRVHHVPEPLIWNLKPDWFPEPVPQIEMTLATGQKQRRTAKAGDAEYYQWQQANSRWERERQEIQIAGRYVMALREIEYPDDLSKPPGFLIAYLNGSYPENTLLRKKVWLDATILAHGKDLAAIMAAIMSLGQAETVTAEDVSEVKKSSESSSEEEDLTEPEDAEKIL